MVPLIPRRSVTKTRLKVRLRIVASLADDINAGWVWLPEGLLAERSVIKIYNCDTRRAVYCESLPIGENFITRYNESHNTKGITDSEDIVAMNEWYRKRLGIRAPQVEHDFKITVADNPFGHLMASVHHPQIVVRLAMELAILGLVLGAIGLFK